MEWAAGLLVVISAVALGYHTGYARGRDDERFRWYATEDWRMGGSGGTDTYIAGGCGGTEN
jgi:hypothetical protein